MAITVHDPRGYAPKVVGKRLAPRLSALDGKTIYLVDCLFDNTDVGRATPEERNIAQVFQFPVVYDTMTVYDNLAFPLRDEHHDRRLSELRREERRVAVLGLRRGGDEPLRIEVVMRFHEQRAQAAERGEVLAACGADRGAHGLRSATP